MSALFCNNQFVLGSNSIFHHFQLFSGQVRIENGCQGHREQLEGRSSIDHPSSGHCRSVSSVEECSLHSNPYRVQSQEQGIEKLVQRSGRV